MTSAIKKYSVEGKKFSTFADAADYARGLLLGRHYDDYIYIDRWRPGEGFNYWEPHRWVVMDKSGKPVVKRDL